MKEPEYTEGPKARENFERGMKTLFQTTKSGVAKAKKKARKKRAKKTTERDVSRDSGGEV
jgi:hypothetical protein